MDGFRVKDVIFTRNAAEAMMNRLKVYPCLRVPFLDI